MWDNRIQCMPCTFGIVKIAGRIGLQVHRKFMEVFGDLMIVVECLVKICFSISIQINKLRDLIATTDKDFVIDDLQPERLKHSSCNSSPY